MRFVHSGVEKSALYELSVAAVQSEKSVVFSDSGIARNGEGRGGGTGNQRTGKALVADADDEQGLVIWKE